MNKTKNFYNQHSNEYVQKSNQVDFTDLYIHLQKHTNNAEYMLDVGCGSGRDSLYFAKQDKLVVAIDYAENIIQEAKKLNPHRNIKYLVSDISNFSSNLEFDLIWANASLLHLTKKDIPKALNTVKSLMSKDAIFYSSFKEGIDSEYDSLDRYFSYYTQTGLAILYKDCGFEIIEIFTNKDKTNRNLNWLNVVAKKL